MRNWDVCGAEWLEVDGFGGFASGTVEGERTRRYHALLLGALQPPARRLVLVNGLEAWLEWQEPTEREPSRRWLTRQCYRGEVTHPAPEAGVESVGFDQWPWPSWVLGLGAVRVRHECFVSSLSGETVMTWLVEEGGLPAGTRLNIRPLVSGRDFHSLQRHNSVFDFGHRAVRGNVCFQPYGSDTAFSALSSGEFTASPDWYRDFLYCTEFARGLDYLEDLATPGIFSFPLSEAGAMASLVLRTGASINVDTPHYVAMLRQAELRQRRGPKRGLLPAVRQRERAADAYVAARGRGATLLAGYPWFGDWGRDTFISLRGLAIARERYASAASILREWAGWVSQGMLPNRFPDDGGGAEYNSVDAALWFVVAAYELLLAYGDMAEVAAVRAELETAIDSIVSGYRVGSRHGIACDGDGFLRAGAPGTQLTWMDARINGVPVTPRAGKPVEIQALWFNALSIADALELPSANEELTERLRGRFAEVFARPHGGLYDVADTDHVIGQHDAAIRPNQLLAVGGLPFPLIQGDLAKRVVQEVEQRLLTPWGLRTLAPEEPAYCPRFEGGPAERDRAYHQGTVWPWLIGPFVDAWLNVHGDSPGTRKMVERDFLASLQDYVQGRGLGHLPEVFDGDAPHRPGGCFAQAWSLAELIRIEKRLKRD